MSATREVVSVELARIACGVCGGVYAITERHRKHCEDHAKSWHCPYCQTGWGFEYGGNPLDKAKEEVRRERARREEAERRAASAEGSAKRERDRANGYKGAMRKVRKRVACGVCPACTRTFQNLAAHMKSEHPDYPEANG